MKKLGQPIIRLDADHDSTSSKKLSTEYCRRLQSTLYTAARAKGMLTWNLSVENGLVNGYIGTVKDFLFLEEQMEQMPPLLPNYMVVEFPDYIGEPFFEGEMKKKRVV